MRVLSTLGIQRRTPSSIWRAHCGTVFCRRPNRGLTAGGGAGTRNIGRAHDRGAQGGVRTQVNSIQRHPLVATERCRLEASGSR
jgi:hypothetical protein